MSESQNQAAWLTEAGSPLRVFDAPMPVAGPQEIVIKNVAIAVNPLDWHMAEAGVFIKRFPAIIGCDVAGVVDSVGDDVQRFEKGNRVIGHTIGLTTGDRQHGAYARYSVVSTNKAAILPDTIDFEDGVTIPFALEAAVCALSLKVPGTAMPGVPTPALGLPYPSVGPTPSINKVLIVYGGSSSVGSMTTQLAKATGVHVISIVGSKNVRLAEQCGAAKVLDRAGKNLVKDAVESVTKSGMEFVGIFDAISSPETYANDLAILEELGGGHLACTHPPPADVPENVKAGMIFAVNDIATPVWTNYVTAALDAGCLLCLPAPTVLGTGLEHLQEGLQRSKAGVSATKLVVILQS